MDIKQRFGRVVRRRRRALEVSQEVFGFAIGMSQSYVSLIENGQMNITLETVEQICVALKLEVPEMFSLLAEG